MLLNSFRRGAPDAATKQLHQLSCNFQEYLGKSEDTPVEHYLKGLSISIKSSEQEKVKYQPQNVAENQLPQNARNSWYLQGLTHKQNGYLL